MYYSADNFSKYIFLETHEDHPNPIILEFMPDYEPRTQIWYSFPNRRGASVILGGWAYGGHELGILYIGDDDWGLDDYSGLLDYDDPVVGHLTPAKELEWLNKIYMAEPYEQD